MRKPTGETVLIILVVLLIAIASFCVARCVSADDGSLKDAVDTVIGTKVRDPGDYSVQYTVRDTPTGQRVYDREGNWLYKIENGKVYDMDRNRVFNIEKNKDSKK